MIQLAAPLIDQNLGYARRLVADLAEGQMASQPVPGVAMNHAAWVIGHVAWVCDFGATLLGEAAAIDPGWKELFSSAAKPDRSDYPTKEGWWRPTRPPMPGCSAWPWRRRPRCLRLLRPSGSMPGSRRWPTSSCTC